MGDKDFEKFLGSDDDPINNNNDQGEEADCHYRLFLEAISDRADTVANLYNSTIELLNLQNKINLFPTTSKFAEIEEFLMYLIRQAKVTFGQSDYLISRLMDIYDPDEDESETPPK
jgi:hypothetical protein